MKNTPVYSNLGHEYQNTGFWWKAGIQRNKTCSGEFEKRTVGGIDVETKELRLASEEKKGQSGKDIPQSVPAKLRDSKYVRGSGQNRSFLGRLLIAVGSLL